MGPDMYLSHLFRDSFGNLLLLSAFGKGLHSLPSASLSGYCEPIHHSIADIGNKIKILPPYPPVVSKSNWQDQMYAPTHSVQQHLK